MALATVHSRAQSGVAAPSVTVEVHLANGLPSLSIVGLPEAAVKESKDRVRAALQNAHFDFPARRITINLAPADLPKEGGRFDLPIALGILAASGQLPREALERHECLGELGLSGELRPVRGALPAALQARNVGRALLLPETNADEAALVQDARVFGARHLLDVCAHLREETPLSPWVPALPKTPEQDALDLADVKGQHRAKRALEVAAAGQHNLLFIGPPGSGKTLLASRLPTLLPPLSDEEALAAAAVASVSRTGFDPSYWRERPFRAPHHTASAVALVGGGAQPQPGEISLAHHGVLFLDELPEFGRHVLEVLREPLESGAITVARAAHRSTFPAAFQLVAAMNPCPCGHLGDPDGACRCTEEQVRRYRSRLSGPLLDRIDLHLEVPRVPPAALQSGASGESSATVRTRVTAALARQQDRRGKPNARLAPRDVERFCALSRADAGLLETAVARLALSARGYHRVLKVARTIADLAGSDAIATEHLTEALGYRCLDRR